MKMAKYLIKQDKNGGYYASKKLFGIFDIGVLRYVDGTASFDLSDCERLLRECLKNPKKYCEEVTIKEIEIK